MIYFEPYHSWSGHYSQYVGELSNCNDVVIKNSLSNRFVFKKKPKSSILFVISRFYNCLVCLIKLMFYILVENKFRRNQTVHLIDFEPVSAMLFSPLFIIFKVNLICTVHSVQGKKNNNVLLDKIANYQKKVLFLFLELCSYKVIVHNDNHLEILLSFVPNLKNKAYVVNYPCPNIDPSIQIRTSFENDKILVSGIMRVDKGIYDFLESAQQVPDLLNQVYLAGLFEDRRIAKFKTLLLGYVDSYVEEAVLSELYRDASFLLIPYGVDYTGGAGPLMDAMSRGLPVIVSSNNTLKNFVEKYNVGFVYQSAEDIPIILSDISEQHYSEMSSNSLSFAKVNSWQDFRTKHEKVY